VRHLRPILCPTVLQRRHQRPIRCAIREIESGDAEDAAPGIIAKIRPDPRKCSVQLRSRIKDDAGISPILDDFREIMDRQPSITLEADDHLWSIRAVTFSGSMVSMVSQMVA
jgi:hypothetical protein